MLLHGLMGGEALSWTVPPKKSRAAKKAKAVPQPCPAPGSTGKVTEAAQLELQRMPNSEKKRRRKQACRAMIQRSQVRAKSANRAPACVSNTGMFGTVQAPLDRDAAYGGRSGGEPQACQNSGSGLSPELRKTVTIALPARPTELGFCEAARQLPHRDVALRMSMSRSGVCVAQRPLISSGLRGCFTSLQGSCPNGFFPGLFCCGFFPRSPTRILLTALSDPQQAMQVHSKISGESNLTRPTFGTLRMTAASFQRSPRLFKKGMARGASCLEKVSKRFTVEPSSEFGGVEGLQGRSKYYPLRSK